VHGVGQRLNLSQLCEPLGGTEGLIETVGLKTMMECMKNKRECQQGLSSILRGTATLKRRVRLTKS